MVQWTERKKETGKEKMDDQELVKMVKMVVVVDVVDVVTWYRWCAGGTRGHLPLMVVLPSKALRATYSQSIENIQPSLN